ncbi:hypothetical protein [Nitrosococcus oceani]|uniref:Uncharacterized protein n=2 Tax=Nitrosococcus oceani TaxID=1229 RepID=Q3JDQ0_NITOC|nr:hypothetical protein [Nitrosococcus oceani]KFI20516.1 hypothetical protein IB75_02750 [Nitrosococcus oceani C-27]ABA57046.1 hypothetical protein Noc_0524 [Nitrosococcus oceani ATCC 19707]EDZ65978.1 hypothetical protein NOC27_2658 [Nitrosococcus oceani AFC27]KFI23622.1 hypothetical protein HW44_02840 [Nitrosococcus oceani]GEM19941.1 hypothetical protein NONS58_13420 [Nitrosococcus oceani]
MSQIINLELSNSTFEAIQKKAKEAGLSPSNLIKELLEKKYHSKVMSEEGKDKARSNFERHFGGFDLGYSMGADNEDIDKELANSYMDSNGAG